MARYLISFDDGAMVVSEEDLPAVSDATHAVVREAQAAGVWVTGGGLIGQSATVVSTDGSITVRPYPETKAVIGGFSILDVSSYDEALRWARKLAVACGCAQEVRELMDDPEA